MTRCGFGDAAQSRNWKILAPYLGWKLFIRAESVFDGESWLGRILLQIKLQPISSNLKARLGHRNLAADFIGITPHLDFDFSLESYILALPCQCRIGWISSYGAQSNLLCWPCKNVKPLFDTSFLKSWWLVIPLSKLKWKRLSDNTPMCQIVLVYMVRIVLLDWYSDSYTTTYQ